MKKVLALVLVAVMALGMTISAAALTSDDYYDDQDLKVGLGYSWVNIGRANWEEEDERTSSHENEPATLRATDDVHPSDEEELRFFITHSNFLNTSSKGPANTRLSATFLRKSKIAVRSQVGAGSKVIKSLNIDTKKGAVVLKFVDEWVSTKEQDFEILVYLTIDGRRMDEWGITLIGTLANEETSVYEDFDYVDLSRGFVAVAEEFVPNIEVDLGNGVSIFTKFFKSKKYYGTASREADEAADIVMKQYPDIDNVVILKTVGLNSTGDIVKLSVDYTDYYVYDKDLNYIGQSNEMLPFSSTYYLANKALDVGTEPDEDDEDEEPEDGAGINPGTGGDGAATNANANPGTGR